MISSLKQIAEWYLGVESSSPGEATAWTWRSSGLLASAPKWLVAIIIVATVASIVFVYRRDAQRLSWQRRWLLVGLRLAAVALLFGLLFQVSLTIDRTALPFVVVMVDDSGSMQFQDDFTGTDDESYVQSVSATGPVTRIELTAHLLTNDGGLLSNLTNGYRIRLYRFADQAELIRLDNNRDVSALSSAIQKLSADGDETHPSTALQQVLDETRGSAAAVVILTDGISTDGDEQRLQSVSQANGSTIPLYVIGTGSERASADLELVSLSVDDVAIVNETVLFTADLKSSGFDDEEVLLELRDTATNERLAGKSVRITQAVQPIELSYVPPVAGEFDYELRIAPPEGEHVVDNNADVRHVSVRDGRIRVLLVDRLPRYEFRYLKHLLERSEGITGSIELSTILFDADPEWAALDDSAAELSGQLPATIEALNEFDVVIFGDVDPLLINQRVQDNLRDFVRESGGGLVLIAGPKFNPHAYRGTSLEPLVPAALDQVTASSFRSDNDDGLHIEPTVAGQRGTQLFRFAPTEVENSRAVSLLANVFTHLELQEAPAGSTVLAAGKDGTRPVIISQQYGAGRVVLHATDDLWMWRYQAGDEYYGRYWVSLVRSLTRSSTLGRDRNAELMTNRENYERGEDIVFQLRFLDSRQEPTDRKVAVNVDRRGGATEVLELTPSPEFPGVYSGAMSASTDGTYHAWVSKPTFEDVPPTADFRVESGSREMLVRNLDVASMKAAAKATRGRYYSIGTANRLVNDLPTGRTVAVESGEPIPLWSRPEILLLMAMLLGFEWFLRKNARLV